MHAYQSVVDGQIFNAACDCVQWGGSKSTNPDDVQRRREDYIADMLDACAKLIAHYDAGNPDPDGVRAVCVTRKTELEAL